MAMSVMRIDSGNLGTKILVWKLETRNPTLYHDDCNISSQMAPTLGKRKRITREELERPSRSPSPSSESQGSDGEDLQAIFRRAFEAKFKPLDIEPVNPKSEEEEVQEEEQEEQTDWSGISSEDEDQVEVFEYADTRHTGDRAPKAEMRAFMVHTIPAIIRIRPI